MTRWERKEALMIQRRNKKGSRVASKLSRPVLSHDLQSIELPGPSRGRGTSVIRALHQRRTIREIRDRKLSLQVLSNLLWAAWGVNRKTGPFGIPGRTAASASNSQEIDLYVVLEEGTYLYDAIHQSLIPAVAGDLRALAINPGQANLAAKAPVHLIYVVDVHKLSHTSGFQEPGLQDPKIQESYYYVDTGLIAGNVYLFAASQGLASWFHNCDKAGLAAKLNLRRDQRILFGQTVGYPVK
jgi:nitroreductase